MRSRRTTVCGRNRTRYIPQLPGASGCPTARCGYVTLKCGSDRRCRLVELTPKGSGLAVSTSDHVIAAERETWGDFTEEEQDSLIELLSKYNKRLKTRMEEKNEK